MPRVNYIITRRQINGRTSHSKTSSKKENKTMWRRLIVANGVLCIVTRRRLTWTNRSSHSSIRSLEYFFFFFFCQFISTSTAISLSCDWRTSEQWRGFLLERHCSATQNDAPRTAIVQLFHLNIRLEICQVFYELLSLYVYLFTSTENSIR